MKRRMDKESVCSTDCQFYTISLKRFLSHVVFQFGFNMFEPMPRAFKTQFRCYSVIMFPGNEREDVERGGKSKDKFIDFRLSLSGTSCIHGL